MNSPGTISIPQIIEVGVHDERQEEGCDGAGEVEVLEHKADLVSLPRAAADLTTDLPCLARAAMDLASLARARPSNGPSMPQLGGG